MDHLYQFERPGSRHTCPACRHRKEFTRYINVETGELLPEYVGRCNRRDKCGYHYSAKDYLQDNKIESRSIITARKPERRNASLLPWDLVDKSSVHRGENYFVEWLRSMLPEETVSAVVNQYHIGTALKPWRGSVIFWQVDASGNVRTGKVMLYNRETGKRVKNPIDHFSWIHAIMTKAGRLSDFNLQQCFFGEHLTTGAKRIAIVESEKTAILASVFFPRFTWIASGGLCNLTREKSRVLTGKDVFLFPDKGCFNEWTKRANEIRDFARVEVSDFLERLPGKPDGYDLADLLSEPRTAEKLKDGREIKLGPAGFPEDWAA
jgi:hypothetical protein